MTELDLACNLMEHRAAPGRSAKAVVNHFYTIHDLVLIYL